MSERFNPALTRRDFLRIAGAAAVVAAFPSIANTESAEARAEGSLSRLAVSREELRALRPGLCGIDFVTDSSGEVVRQFATQFDGTPEDKAWGKDRTHLYVSDLKDGLYLPWRKVSSERPGVRIVSRLAVNDDGRCVVIAGYNNYPEEGFWDIQTAIAYSIDGGRTFRRRNLDNSRSHNFSGNSLVNIPNSDRFMFISSGHSDGTYQRLLTLNPVDGELRKIQGYNFSNGVYAFKKESVFRRGDELTLFGLSTSRHGIREVVIDLDSRKVKDIKPHFEDRDGAIELDVTREGGRPDKVYALTEDAIEVKDLGSGEERTIFYKERLKRAINASGRDTSWVQPDEMLVLGQNIWIHGYSYDKGDFPFLATLPISGGNVNVVFPAFLPEGFLTLGGLLSVQQYKGMNGVSLLDNGYTAFIPADAKGEIAGKVLYPDKGL